MSGRFVLVLPDERESLYEVHTIENLYKVFYKIGEAIEITTTPRRREERPATFAEAAFVINKVAEAHLINLLQRKEGERL